MLDVISGAMGAFLIIMVILLPYYKKESIDYSRELQQSRAAEEAARNAARTAGAARLAAEETARKAVEAARAAEAARSAAEDTARSAEQTARAARAEAEQNRQRAEAAALQLAKTFLVVHIQWATNRQDIDLHVIDPSGAEFYYERKTIPGRPGALSVDSIYGPGNEVWSASNATAGNYRIYAKLFNPRDVNDTPTITGSIIHRDGTTALPPAQLPTKGVKYLMATVVVGVDGRVSIQ